MNAPNRRGAVIGFAAPPDRVHAGRDRDQLGEVAVKIAVVGRRVEQPLPIRSAVGIVEDREACEMDRAGCA